MDHRWYSVKTYDDLLKLNIEFIDEKIDKTPYSFGPMVGSQELRNNLVKLHQYGILTVGGQETKCEYNMYKDNYWRSFEQRAYLDFYINLDDNKKLAESFIEYLKNKNIIYLIKNPNGNAIITNVKGRRFNLTRTSKSTEHKDKDTFLWNDDTNFWNKYADCEFYGQWGFIKSKSSKIKKIFKNTLYFQLALPEYGKGNLEEILLNICQNVQTTKMLSKKSA